MPLSSPRELHQFLNTLGAQANKRLSQNFLIDGNILRKVVQVADVQKGETILEIGAGPGALTECLIEAGAQVIAIEKDPVFAKALKRFSTIDVFAVDVRDFPLKTLYSEGKKAKVVANLPYHLTTPILALYAPRHDLFSTLTIMVQEEVARRITAKPGTSEYSSLTVFLQCYSTPRYCFPVSAKCFYPAPKVQSAVIILELKPPPTTCPDFFLLVRTAFGQRRKMLTSTLKKLYPKASIEEALDHLSISRQVRPEELSLDQFLAIFSQMGRGIKEIS